MMFWKKTVLFSLLSLFSIATNIESIHFFYKQFSSIALQEMSDIDSEEKKSEDEKSEGTCYLRNEYSNIKLIVSVNLAHKGCLQHCLSFSSADCLQVIYSPPELL
jgi:hypothetical protein